MLHDYSDNSLPVFRLSYKKIKNDLHEIYDFGSIINRKNTNCLKWDLFDTELPMWVADMDFKVAPDLSMKL